MYLLLATWICLNVHSSLSYDLQPPLVKTAYGTVNGLYKTSRDGRLFRSFTGIPYAQPPLGNLRFAAPEPPKPWKDIWDASQEPPVCLQRNYLFTSDPPIEGQEDCLYLNVYIPNIVADVLMLFSINMPSPRDLYKNVTQFYLGSREFTEIDDPNFIQSFVNVKVYQNPPDKLPLLPVMVFIHWGAFIAGRSSPGYFGPEYFMDKDVILVTFNYRLGPFGFLSTTDDEAPGNYGLKDQIAVLEWVQANIESFGGNKYNVTIFGQSAGGGSVHYHLLSSASKGLFHRAISQSGTALAGWAVPLNIIQKQLTILQANFVGCQNSTENSRDIISCLRSVDADELMKSQDLFRPFYGDPLMIFGSVVETPSKRNPKPFLTQTPLEYILKGEINDVPWMTGVVKNEGVFKAGNLIRRKEVREQLNKNFENLILNVLLLFSISSTNPQALYKNVTQFYLGGREFIDIDDPKSIQGFINLYSDRAFMYPLYQSILLHSRKQHKPIYLYNFEYEGISTYGDLFAGTKENIHFDWGVCHCDDLLYLFNSPQLLRESKNYNDIFLSNILLSLWTNFAKYGNPNPTVNPVREVSHWEPLNIGLAGNEEVNSRIELLNITGNRAVGPKLKISSGFYEERMKFWIESDIFENVGLK